MKEILAKVSNKVGAISTKAKTGVDGWRKYAWYCPLVQAWASEPGAGASGAGIGD
ncbi:MAG: hypothetical protein ACLUD2_09450 [Clostridium sp.]